MDNQRNILRNIFVLLLLSIVYLVAFALIAALASFALAEVWLFFVNNVLQPASDADFSLPMEGFFTFAIILILLVSSMRDSSKELSHIHYSQLYISCFPTRELAVSFWLNFRIYLALMAGIYFTFCSWSSFLNLCKIDVQLFINLTNPDFDLYIGKLIGEVKIEIIKQTVSTVSLSILASVMLYFAGKQKELPFLQALLLVGIASSLVVLNSFAIYQLPMLSFTCALLLASVLSCVVCILNRYFKGYFDLILQPIKTFFGAFFSITESTVTRRLIRVGKDRVKAAKEPYVTSKVVPFSTSKDQYLRSYLLFLISSNLLYWSILFSSTLKESCGLNMYNGVYLFFIAIWCFLSLRFMIFAANYDFTKENHTMLIPITPVLVYSLYLGSVLSVFYLSWISTKNKSLIYSFFTVCINPTLGLKYDTLPSSEQGLTIVIASPSESVSWLDTASKFVTILKPVADYANAYHNEQKMAQSQRDLEGLIGPAREVIASDANPKVTALLEEGLRNIYSSQASLLTPEERKDLLNKADQNFSIATNTIQGECPVCPVSPRTGLVRFGDFKVCLENFAKAKGCHMPTVSAVDSNTTINTIEEIVEKAVS